MPVETIVHRLLARVASTPTVPAWHRRTAEGWMPITWGEVGVMVRGVARALIAQGFEPGQTVCILGFNRPEWVAFDLAAMAAGGAPAGIYTTCSPSEVAYIVHHSEAAFVLVEDLGQWAKLQERLGELPLLRRVVFMQGAPKVDHPLVQSWEEFLATGAAVPETTLDARVAGLQEDALATLIYTSGTTGPPKGVMLSHRNLAWTADQATRIVPIQAGDCSLSYLPLSHIAEQMFTLHLPITTGAQVYFAESLAKLPDNLKEVQPTVFFGVPRIWEKFHAKVAERLAAATGVKARLVAWARGAAFAYHARKLSGAPVPTLMAWQHALAVRLVFSKLKPVLGLGRARYCVSGAAPIAREVLEFMASLDVPILEVYGQSEGSGPTSFNQPTRGRFGTVGPAVPGVELRLGDDGEICLRGPNVFLGYFKEEAATAATLVDGWLLSGDLGVIDGDGFLNITGRKKDILITAGGKNIAPRNIEAALKALDIVGEAVLIGDRRKFLTALLTLDPELVAAEALAKGITPLALSTSPELRARVEEHVRRVNTELAQVEQVKKFVVLPEPFSVENGELTPTLKVKRAVVARAYAAQIEGMYQE